MKVLRPIDMDRVQCPLNNRRDFGSERRESLDSNFYCSESNRFITTDGYYNKLISKSDKILIVMVSQHLPKGYVIYKSHYSLHFLKWRLYNKHWEPHHGLDTVSKIMLKSKSFSSKVSKLNNSLYSSTDLIIPINRTRY